MTRKPPARNKHRAFWQSRFGDEYIERNPMTPERLRQRTRMWGRILPCLEPDLPSSILEVGANIGINLMALDRLLSARLVAVEPNAMARERLAATGVVASADIIDGVGDAIALPDNAVDLAFTSGVLIHVDPDCLMQTYAELHRVSRRYLITIEYFSDKPEQVVYRGHHDRLYKRDFGAVWLDAFEDVELIDYGFFWKPATGLDNLTWWLFRKRGA